MQTIRSHVSIGTEQRECPTHQTYTATLWDLQPKPAGYPHLPGSAVVAKFLAPFWSKCPQCDAATQAEVDAHDAAVRGGLTEKQRFTKMRELEANIPPRFAESTLWNWQHGMDQQRRCWNWARDYAQSFDIALQTGRCAVLAGAPGTGKTHLAIGLLRHCIEKGGSGYYTTVLEMLSKIKSTFVHKAPETEMQVIESLRRADLLVIDEVGRSLDSNYELAQFFRILDLRYRDLKPTVIISNLTQDKLRAFLGDAVVDRFREAGGALLTFDWASQRSTKKPSTDTE